MPVTDERSEGVAKIRNDIADGLRGRVELRDR